MQLRRFASEDEHVEPPHREDELGEEDEGRQGTDSGRVVREECRN